ncbi:Nucleolar GTPase/ATPase p130 [Trichoderma guizhouense]|uniref:Nucleolar GTPase/ATPase p130 n=1 Tax=Trichoderma guizhouense TaxID=1491466 RepID=A0A1T3CUC6_9HYPO|nr:Nucleolar GTPase/ATPase p130 [Trichoderma guizhouense]
MDQTSWLDLSADGDTPTSPSPPQSPPSSPSKLTRSKSIIERVASRASEYSISPNTSRSEDQLVGRSGLPPWDRTVDIVFHKYKHGDAKPDKSLALKALTNKFSWDQDCWEPSDFIPLGEVLATFHPYLSVSFDFYATIFVGILSENSFHVTFSPFIAPRLNPLATTWLNKYGIFIKSLIIEVDLSRLGLGPAPQAIDLFPGTGHLQHLLLDFSLSQLERPAEAPFEALILACRRFHGQREDIPDPPEDISESKISIRASSASPQSQHSSAESSGRQSSCDVSEKTVRVVSPAPEDFFENSELDFEYDDEEEEEQDGDDEHTNLDEDSDEGYVVNMSFESSEDSTDSFSSSDSSSNPDTSLALPPSIQEEDLSYCPEKYLSMCNHLVRLRNKVTSLRIAGFSEAYSHAFLATLFPEAKFLPLAQHSYRVAPSTFWPRLRGQKSWVDAGQGTLILDDHEVIPEPCIFPEGPFQLPPPIVYKSSIKSFPMGLETVTRPRNNTVSSGSSLPSQKSLESYEEANTSKSSRSGCEKSKVQKLLDRCKEKSRRRPRPTSAP